MMRLLVAPSLIMLLFDSTTGPPAAKQFLSDCNGYVTHLPFKLLHNLLTEIVSREMLQEKALSLFERHTFSRRIPSH